MDLSVLLQNNLQNTSFLAYPIAFLGGFFVSLTPCIYPLIPIIISYIGSRGEKSRLKAFLLSLFYVLGMAVTYSALGAAAALTGSIFGQIQNTFWANFIVGNIILLFGLSQLDVFQLPLPNFGGVQTGRKDYLGAFLLGLGSGLVAAPCSAAVLGTLLVYVGNARNLIFGITVLFAYSLGMGVLFLFLGTFTGFLTSLPKAGIWGERIKKAFGWLMLAVGEYFLIMAGKNL
ncbi:MAG: sulfite exporter TauE/SafE family protein [Chloroflexi bacterium]|nr:sulfite exporter TauE/SafE family protein [Chloroflexota bacterium]